LWGQYISALMVQWQNTYLGCRVPEFKFRVCFLYLFHGDILGSLGSNLVFINLFAIT
jgi:hypothetical protein